jgi:hypothetical protein
VERLFTVEFGPSRSKRFGKALAEARRGARECSEIEPGAYRARFVLGEEAAAYAALAALLGRVPGQNLPIDAHSPRQRHPLAPQAATGRHSAAARTKALVGDSCAGRAQ